MKGWVQKPIESSMQIKAWLRESAESGIAASRSMLGALPLCASLTSTSQKQDGQQQEDLIHYFLIPCGVSESRYMLFSKHQLPEGIGTENDLPKLSVFHIPNEGADQRLEELVLSKISGDLQPRPNDPEETMDQRLERIAGEIEKHSNYVTCGVLLIGGAVAIANPLLGVGIAAKALIPSVGGLVSVEAMKYGGGRLRRWRERGEQKRSDKQAIKELRGRKTRLIINPFLAKLQRAIDTDEQSFDPGMDDPFLTGEQGLPDGLRQVTLQVLAEYYKQIRTVQGDARLGPEDRRWLEMLHRYAESAR